MNGIIRISRIMMLAAGVLAAQTLLAHNTLKTTVPAADAALDAAPAFIQLGFSDATYLEAIELADADGNPVLLDFEPSIDAAAAFQIPLPRLDAGTYTVQWTIEGTDTHRISGEFSFSVTALKP